MFYFYLILFNSSNSKYKNKYNFTNNSFFHYMVVTGDSGYLKTIIKSFVSCNQSFTVFRIYSFFVEHSKSAIIKNSNYQPHLTTQMSYRIINKKIIWFIYNFYKFLKWEKNGFFVERFCNKVDGFNLNKPFQKLFVIYLVVILFYYWFWLENKIWEQNMDYKFFRNLIFWHLVFQRRNENCNCIVKKYS